MRRAADRPVSWWLRDTRRRRPPLPGDRDADVAILGGGFTGLWTAWHLLEADPTLRVVVCEAEHVGFGASGRNGGWCSPAIGVTPAELARRTTPATARRVVHVLRATVDDVGAFCAAHVPEAAFRKGGILRIARGDHEVPAVEADWAALWRLGLDDGCVRLTAREVADRVAVAGARGAVLDTHGAVVDPGALVTGLARAVEARGGVVHEGTRVTTVVPRGGEVPTRRGGRPATRAPDPLLVTATGVVRARDVVVAGEAWLPRLPAYRRAVLPVYSLIVLTAPLTAAQWAAVGWAGHECLSSRRYTVDYLSRTPDGRILFGGRGAPYHLGSRVAPRFDTHRPTHERLRRELGEWFPQLAGIEFAAAWGGPLGMPRDWMPTVGHDPTTGIAHAFGYTGQGVAATHLAGRILAARILEGASDLDDLPFVDHRPRRWEPEPLRFVAARGMQVALARLDRRAAATGRPPTGRSLPERLLRH